MLATAYISEQRSEESKAWFYTLRSLKVQSEFFPAWWFAPESPHSPVGLHGAYTVEQRLFQQPQVDAGIHGTVQHLQLVHVEIGKPLSVAAYDGLAHGQNLLPLCC